MAKKYYNQIEATNYVTDKDLAIQSFIKYQLDRTQSMFAYENLDDSLPEHMIELMLQKNGNVFVTKVDDKLYAFTGGEGGEPDAYGRPTIYTVANPALKISKNYVIDEDGILIKNDTLEVGLLPMLNKYGSLLVENDISIRTIIIYLRIVGLISASDDGTKASADEFIQKIINGDLTVVGDNPFFDGVKVQSLGNNTSSYIQQFIELEQYLKGSLFNELGLNANYNMKREALTKNETSLNQDFLMPFCDDMLACRKDGWDKVNEMFGTNITVEYSSTWKKREITDVVAMQQANGDSSQLEDLEIKTDNQIDEEIDGVVDETVKDNISDTKDEPESDNTEEDCVDNESEKSTDSENTSDEESESTDDESESQSDEKSDEEEESVDDEESKDGSSQLEDEKSDDESEDEKSDDKSEDEKSDDKSEDEKSDDKSDDEPTDDKSDEDDEEKKKKKEGVE